MKLAFSNSICPQLDLEGLIQKAQAWGYDGLELEAESARATSPACIRRKLADARLTLAALHADMPFAQLDAAKATNGMRPVEGHLRLAQDVGCGLLVLGAGAARGIVATPKALERCGQVLRPLASAAGAAGVKLLLENGPMFPSTRDVWFLRDATALPALRACLNLLNVHRAGEPPSIAIPRLAGALSLVHLGDGEWDAQQHTTRYVPLGSGQLDIAGALELLKGVAYEGWICVRWPAVACEHLPPADELLPAAATYLRNELTKPPIVLSAYKGDKCAPRFATRPAAEPTAAA